MSFVELIFLHKYANVFLAQTVDIGPTFTINSFYCDNIYWANNVYLFSVTWPSHTIWLLVSLSYYDLNFPTNYAIIVISLMNER